MRVSLLRAVVRREGVGDGAGEQRQLLGPPAAERGGGTAGAGDVGAGVPEERAVRGRTAAPGRRGADRVQVLDDGAASAAQTAGQAAAFWWCAGESNLNRGRRRSNCSIVGDQIAL